MINLACFMAALKSTWIRKIFNSESKWLNILYSIVDREKLIKCGNGYAISEECKNMFWKDVFNGWNSVIEKDKNDSWECFVTGHLWWNKNITIGNKQIFYKDFFQKGIYYVNDV